MSLLLNPLAPGDGLKKMEELEWQSQSIGKSILERRFDDDNPVSFNDAVLFEKILELVKNMKNLSILQKMRVASHIPLLSVLEYLMTALPDEHVACLNVFLLKLEEILKIYTDSYGCSRWPQQDDAQLLERLLSKAQYSGISNKALALVRLKSFPSLLKSLLKFSEAILFSEMNYKSILEKGYLELELFVGNDRLIRQHLSNTSDWQFYLSQKGNNVTSSDAGALISSIGIGKNHVVPLLFEHDWQCATSVHFIFTLFVDVQMAVIHQGQVLTLTEKNERKHLCWQFGKCWMFQFKGKIPFLEAILRVMLLKNLYIGNDRCRLDLSNIFSKEFLAKLTCLERDSIICLLFQLDPYWLLEEKYEDSFLKDCPIWHQWLIQFYGKSHQIPEYLQKNSWQLLFQNDIDDCDNNEDFFKGLEYARKCLLELIENLVIPSQLVSIFEILKGVLNEPTGVSETPGNHPCIIGAAKLLQRVFKNKHFPMIDILGDTWLKIFPHDIVLRYFLSFIDDLESLKALSRTSAPFKCLLECQLRVLKLETDSQSVPVRVNDLLKGLSVVDYLSLLIPYIPVIDSRDYNIFCEAILNLQDEHALILYLSDGFLLQSAEQPFFGIGF